MNRVAVFALVSAGLLAGGCTDSGNRNGRRPDAAGPTTRADAPRPGKVATEPAVRGDSAVAIVRGAGDNKDKINGTLTFTDTGGGVRVHGEVTGLSPGKHGFHVHQTNDLTDPQLKSAGPHFNPDGTKHGGPHGEMRHAGDLGNITADADGKAKVDEVFKGLSIRGDKNGIVGKSVIIHAAEDDLKSDPAGNSGDRIAGGAIESKAPGGATTRPAHAE